MDVDSFRYVLAGLCVTIIGILGIMWRDMVARQSRIDSRVQKIDKAVALDLRGLSFRIRRIEQHLGLPPLISEISAMDDTLG